MIRIGVIGTGSMGRNHARVCADTKPVKLTGIADSDTALSKKIAKQYDTTPYSSYKDLISSIDAAIIATPTITHYDIAKELLHQGKHVLVEKPVCDSVGHAQELVKLAEKQGLVFAVGHIERHNPVVNFLKEGINEGKFGDLLTLTSKRVSNFPGRIRDVGVILDFGVHDIDVMRYLNGEITKVYTKAGTFNKNISHEDHATIMVTFENNTCGVIEVNWLTPLKIRKLFLTCSKHCVEADYINQQVTLSSSSFETIDEGNLYRVPIQYNVDHITLQKREPLRNEIEDFVEAIQHQKQPLVTGFDGMQTLKIAEAALQSYTNGKEVKIT